MSTAYTPYDLLRTLIERAGWPDETEKLLALAAVREWEGMQIFGNLASMYACQHDKGSDQRGKCRDCGRRI